MTLGLLVSPLYKIDRARPCPQFPRQNPIQMNTSAGVEQEPLAITRRHFLKLSALSAAVASAGPLGAQTVTKNPAAAEAVENPEYLTREQDFVNVGRGSPPPHELSAEKRRAAGLARKTWELEVAPDPDSDAQAARPMSKDQGNAFNWEQLMGLAKKHAVRFLHVISCTNMPKPLGMGLWEGVPLREVIWLTHPRSNIRRAYYYGYHNEDLSQRFQSSLAIGRVLEEPLGELPVILAYKLNGEWLTPKRGGPVRMIVPGAYGNKSVKWIQRVVLTNNPRQNDTYAEWNNDTESPLKTCASFRSVPEKVKAGEAVPVAGVAQVGMSGLSKAQYWLCPHEAPLPEHDAYFTGADWRDAEIMPAPSRWGGGLPEGKLPEIPLQFDANTGKPREWPLRGTIAYWTAVLGKLPPGKYDVRCRTIDANGVAQPMPRPFPKSGYNAIHKVSLTVES
jgi:DMSO/TMAO reductase YedYZ molybdopterin-dependent catalytic subunit